LNRDEIDRVAGAIKATHPDFRYQPIAEPEELGDSGRIQWVSGRPGEPPAYAGTDFIIAQDGPDCRRFPLFRQATLSWPLPPLGTRIRSGLSENRKQFEERSRWESEAPQRISPIAGEELQVKFLSDSEENSLRY
jgi:hypothetical protein